MPSVLSEGTSGLGPKSDSLEVGQAMARPRGELKGDEDVPVGGVGNSSLGRSVGMADGENLRTGFAQLTVQGIGQRGGAALVADNDRSPA